MAKAKTKAAPKPNADKDVAAALRRAEEGTGTEVEKGYGGSGDYATGKVTPGGQMSVQQIREFNRDKR